MSVDVVRRVEQLAARVERGSEEVLQFLVDGEYRRRLEAAVAAVRRGEVVGVEGLVAAFARYDELRSTLRRVGGGSTASSSSRSVRSRSTRRQVPRSGRS